MTVRVVFMGSPDFALPTLQALAKHTQVVGVVTQPNREAGRGKQIRIPPVAVQALELGLPVIQPERLRQPEALEQLQAWAPDLIVVAAFGQILRQVVLDLPPYGCINVHASLLPRWRGAAPIQACILAGDEFSGVTIMRMDAGVDTGAILCQRRIRLAGDETAGSLSDKLAEMGAGLLIETLPAYLEGRIVPQAQDGLQATYAPMLSKEAGMLDFSRPASELSRQVRAYFPWPGSYTLWNEEVFKIHRAHWVAYDRAEQRWPEGMEPGRRSILEGLPAIASGGGWLVLDEVQPAGKRSMAGAVFLNGARNWAAY